MKRKISLLLIILGVIWIVAGCGDTSAEGEKVIRMGFNPGPYMDEFKLGILPQLEEKGYTIEYTDFTDGIQPNLAVAEGKIDANIFQHTTYMNAISEQEGLDLVGAVHVPTPPMGIYSKKHDSSDDPENAVVVMPSSPVNMTRALGILEDMGWITLKDDINLLKVTEKDIKENKYNIEIRPMEAAQGVRALDDVDYVAIQGNHAVSSGLSLTSALHQEKMDEPYINVVTVSAENENKQFVKDLVEAYHSEAFQEAILSNEQFDGFTLPSYFSE